MTRILGIDVGEKRVGVAISDAAGIMASPYGFLDRASALDKLLDIIREEKVGEIVVGMPRLHNGKLGSQASDVNDFVIELQQKTNLPIGFENEILTSHEAKRRLAEASGGKIPQKGEIDAMAAAIILEDYLNRS